MIIANPIYNTVFYNLMHDLQIAKDFLSSILGKKIYDLSIEPEKRNIFNIVAYKPGRLKIFHLDFVAEIESEEGRKKVFIDLQQTSAYDNHDNLKFYIEELYTENKKKCKQLFREEKSSIEEVEEKTKQEPEMIPIIPILILGFELDPDKPENKLMIFEEKRKVFNPNNQIEINGVLVDEEISLTSKLVECLSHDLIVIQIPFIPENPKTKLEIILSVFEQRFLQKDHWYKEYKHHIENSPILLAMLHKLEIIAHDEKVAISLQQEEINELMYQNMEADARAKEEIIVDQANSLVSKDKVIEEEKRKAEEEKRKAEEEKRKAEEADKKNMALEKKLENMRAELAKINNKS